MTSGIAPSISLYSIATVGCCDGTQDLYLYSCFSARGRVWFPAKSGTAVTVTGLVRGSAQYREIQYPFKIQLPIGAANPAIQESILRSISEISMDLQSGLSPV